MSPPTSYQPSPSPDAPALMLDALAWICADPARARRLLDVTGMSADHLRSHAAHPATLAAVGRFLGDHEPDLLDCADALCVAPGVIVAAGARLGRG